MRNCFNRIQTKVYISYTIKTCFYSYPNNNALFYSRSDDENIEFGKLKITLDTEIEALFSPKRRGGKVEIFDKNTCY